MQTQFWYFYSGNTCAIGKAELELELEFQKTSVELELELNWALNFLVELELELNWSIGNELELELNWRVVEFCNLWFQHIQLEAARC